MQVCILLQTNTNIVYHQTVLDTILNCFFIPKIVKKYFCQIWITYTKISQR